MITDENLFEDPALQRLEQASLWLQRMRTAGPDERVVEAWLDWCQRDPLNQLAFDEIAAVWQGSAQIAREPAQGTGRASRTDWSRRRALAASVAGLGIAMAAGAWWMTRPAPEQVLTSELSSPVGSNTVQRLADGSLLELGGGTRVTVLIGAKSRRVELHEGELFVTVQHDASRPFSVNSGLLDAVATGTAFNVLRTDGRTTVTVAEGTVQATYGEEEGPAGLNMRLQASQQLVYAHATQQFDMRDADPASASAWRTGRLIFNQEPLSEVIARVNRYAARKIVIEDPAIGALLLTTTAHTDNIQKWLQGLQITLQVTVVQLADGRQLIRARPGLDID